MDPKNRGYLAKKDEIENAEKDLAQVMAYERKPEKEGALPVGVASFSRQSWIPTLSMNQIWTSSVESTHSLSLHFWLGNFENRDGEEILCFFQNVFAAMCIQNALKIQTAFFQQVIW